MLSALLRAQLGWVQSTSVGALSALFSAQLQGLAEKGLTVFDTFASQTCFVQPPPASHDTKLEKLD